MALGDFFRVNMPYGMKRNEKNEWFVFNREYKPLGWNTNEWVTEEEFPVYVKYRTLTDTKLMKIADNIGGSVIRDEEGEISAVFLYDDVGNPKDSPKNWNQYFEKIKLLSNLKAI